MLRLPEKTYYVTFLVEVALGLVTNQLSVGMKNILRDDGLLRDACVDVHSLSRSVLNLIGGYNLRGVWLADRYYAVGDVVDFNGSVWACHQAHNAGAVFDETKYSRFGFAGGDDAALAAVQAGNYARQASNAKNAAEAASETAIENANTLSAKLQDIAANLEQSSQNARSAKTSADVAEAASMRAQNAAVQAEEIANPGIPYTGATKHINLNGKNLTNTGEVKLGDGNNEDYQQLMMGNYERSPGKGNYGVVSNSQFPGGSSRWMGLSNFGEDGNHISSLFADNAKAYVRIGNTNHELAMQIDMRSHIPGTSTPWQSASPNQIPKGIYEGLSSNASLENGGDGVMRIVKAAKESSSHYATYREGALPTGEIYRQYANNGLTAWGGRIRIDAGGGIPLGAVLAFPAAITNPPGYLKADGSTFDQATYPDLYAALGNSNNLPDLRHDSIGMMAWCPTDTPPAGWLPCDGRTISQSDYPELYAYLGSRYGAPGKLPDAQDRYIRNAGNGLTVGQLQDDEIKRHVHKFISSDVTGSDALAVVRSDLFEQDDDAPDQLQHADIVGDGAWGDNGWAQPKLTSPYATGGDETRPKTIVLKLCIKARSGRGDVSYWVRAYGAVSNAGSLDAAALAGSIQQINSAAQQAQAAAQQADQRIGGVEQHINGQLGTLTQQIQALQQGGPQQLAETGYQQLPGGLILQWGRVQLQRNNNRINYPIAFQVACLIVNATTGANTVQIGVHSPDKTGFTIYASSQHGNHTHWLAIGH